MRHRNNDHQHPGCVSRIIFIFRLLFGPSSNNSVYFRKQHICFAARPDLFFFSSLVKLDCYLVVCGMHCVCHNKNQGSLSERDKHPSLGVSESPLWHQGGKGGFGRGRLVHQEQEIKERGGITGGHSDQQVCLMWRFVFFLVLWFEDGQFCTAVTARTFSISVRAPDLRALGWWPRHVLAEPEALRHHLI